MVSRNNVIGFVFIIIIAAGIGGAAYWFLVVVPSAPPKPANPYNVAIVFGTGGLGDKSFNDGCYAGAVMANETYGFDFTYSQPMAIAEFEPMLRAYCLHAEYVDPYDLIIGVGYETADALAVVAAEYPDQRFAVVDVDWMDFLEGGPFDNVMQINWEEEQGSALVGALAGFYTADSGINKLGFIGGKDTPLIHKFCAGFYWGANYTNPALNIRNATQGTQAFRGWVGDWADIPGGQTLADGMYKTDGVDIIFAAAGRSGLGVINSAKALNGTADVGNKRIFAIGVDSPQMYLGCADPENPAPPTAVLTSMLKRVDLGVFTAIEAACWSGNFDDYVGVTRFGLVDGGVGWELNETLLGFTIPQSYKDTINMISQGIINGTFDVPVDFTWI